MDRNTWPLHSIKEFDTNDQPTCVPMNTHEIKQSPHVVSLMGLSFEFSHTPTTTPIVFNGENPMCDTIGHMRGYRTVIEEGVTKTMCTLCLQYVV